MSFLSKLSKLKRNSPSYHADNSSNINKKNEIEEEPSSLLPTNYIRDEDPAVRRLKEIRNKERLKNKSNEKPKDKIIKRRSTTRRKKINDTEQDIGTVYKRRLGSNSNKSSQTNIMKRREPIKKMSFEELMKQADSQDIIKTNAIRNNTKTTHLNKPGFKKRNPIRGKNNDIMKQNQVPPPPSSSSSSKNINEPKVIHLNTRIGTSIARPHARFQAKLNKHKQYAAAEDEYDEDLDDFIEEDEEEEEERIRDNRGYDRDEIWAMFNRPGQRNHYRPQEDEWDSDDMETNEIDIMAEEEEATRAARLEDKREQNWLRKHDEAKAKARNRSKR
ncbi:similar to Saccharomyces cerevisiae YER161C SPT2 Protein involved in negative regulation of transcription [Maudiozyma saulgeensis]|uniref:Similar to Saccharomyces cerevisiae YER161C SPT2 Protein involved in negative regulation of transcription n=1 Tax=Maudiozyma saulgeensis TaxID=1789683 RepID=A0A1X7R894_9SACH|nr:similar to Saccharomyces cerevisiae YER161C SPT2 Protein involved in negative regulation of transcription [Kazachstania saulgeensis]